MQPSSTPFQVNLACRSKGLPILVKGKVGRAELFSQPTVAALRVQQDGPLSPTNHGENSPNPGGTKGAQDQRKKHHRPDNLIGREVGGSLIQLTG
jgi:hypothetical protein